MNYWAKTVMDKEKIIFIIDDDPDDCEILRNMLQSIDHEILVWESLDPEEALMKLNLEGRLPDLIFLDLNMPKIDGYECLARIKTMDKTRHIPVHMYSSTSIERDIKECLNLGAEGFITKTSNLSLLKRTLRDILLVQLK